MGRLPGYGIYSGLLFQCCAHAQPHANFVRCSYYNTALVTQSRSLREDLGWDSKTIDIIPFIRTIWMVHIVQC